MFTLIFLAALVVMVLTKLWLASRQIRHVGRHRGAVPERFADTIIVRPPESGGLHHRTHAAVDARGAGRRGRPDRLHAAGRPAALNQLWLRFGGGGYFYGVALIASVVLIGGLIDLPFSLYRQFVLEAALRLQQDDVRPVLADMLKGRWWPRAGPAAAAGGAVADGPGRHVCGSGPGCCGWLQLLMLVIYPTFIAPLFNKFSR
jgi:STE24 endopeptidase